MPGTIYVVAGSRRLPPTPTSQMGTARRPTGVAGPVRRLSWVHGNAAAFGGDPETVTLFGQSTGSAAVAAILASSRAASPAPARLQKQPNWPSASPDTSVWHQCEFCATSRSAE